MSDNWQRYLDPHFANVVQALDPLLFLDKLKEIKLVASEEYTKLHNILKLESPQACARHLLQILPKKGPSSFGKFLDVLRNTPGQEHIADTVKPMDTDCTDGCVRVKGKLLQNQLQGYTHANRFHSKKSTNVQGIQGGNNVMSGNTQLNRAITVHTYCNKHFNFETLTNSIRTPK